MKRFEILRELPPCDTETGSEQTLLEKCADRRAQQRAATGP